MPSTGIDLGRNEKVLWTGAPRQGFMLHGQDLFLIPFSALWAGIAFAGFGGPRRPALPGMLAIFPAFFLIVALYITIGRFFVDMWARARTTYAVTTERVIIQSGFFTPTTKSLNLRTLSDITLSERGNGSGTITFGPGYRGSAWGSSLRWPGMPEMPMFDSITGAREVYDTIRDAQRSTPGSLS